MASRWLMTEPSTSKIGRQPVGASGKKRKLLQPEVEQETSKPSSSSRPKAARGQDEAIGGSLVGQNSSSAAEGKTGPECPPDMEDEQELQKDSREEVEDVFAKLKKHREAKAAMQVLRKQKLGTRKPAGSKDDIFGKGVKKARRRDADGFAIYSEEELGLNKGGSTPQCPFECECCF